MAVQVELVFHHIAAELSNESAVIPLHLPVRLRVIRRGIARSYTEQTQDALILDRGKLRSVVRKNRVGDAIGGSPCVYKGRCHGQRRGLR